MESKTYMQAIIENIEQNISEKINVEKLSSECFVSPRQLYRDFYSFTGHSVNEYIRKRKLSKALSLLKYSEISVTDIAFLCGYSSGQALCRDIKLLLNITPTEYRNSMDIYYFPLHDGIKMKQIVVKSQTIPQMCCLKFYHSQLTGIENRAVSYLQTIIPEYTGKLLGRNGLQSGNRFCYELYIEYSNEYIRKIRRASFNDITVIPGYTAVFACATVKNNEQDIHASWDFLYGHWLKNSMFEQDNIPYFEEYIVRTNIIKKLILYLPVKPRENFYKISVKYFDDRLFVAAAKAGINAEKSASNMVAEFIADHYPFLLKSQKEFYVSKIGSCYTCGMHIKSPINIPAGKSVEIRSIPKGLYAVLEGSCYGSGNEYEQVLLKWLQDHGFEAEGIPFSIYDISKGSSQKEIIVKSQIKIKDGRI